MIEAVTAPSRTAAPELARCGPRVQPAKPSAASSTWDPPSDRREERRIFTIILLIVSLGFVSLPLNAATIPFSVVVDKYHDGQNGQLIDGYKHYKTISAALDSAPMNETEWFVIYIKPGTYIEQVRVNRPRISLIGAGRERTILMFSAAVGSRDHMGRLYGRASATLSILASDFNLQDMTVKNSFDYKANRRKDATDPSKIFLSQAPAILIHNNHDRASFHDCSIYSAHDTFYLGTGRSYVNNCVIAGSVDFIFGPGRAVFERCTIVSRYDGLSSRKTGVISAPSTPRENEFGFLFFNSIFTREQGVGIGVVYLGRPYRRPDGMVAIIDSWLGPHIHPDGWTAMAVRDASGNRVIHRPDEARFYESNSRGPGAIVNHNRRQLTSEQRDKFVAGAVLSDWTPYHDDELTRRTADDARVIFDAAAQTYTPPTP